MIAASLVCLVGIVDYKKMITACNKFAVLRVSKIA